MILPSTPKYPQFLPSNSVQRFSYSSSIYDQVSKTFAFKLCTILVHIILPSTFNSPQILPSNSVQSLFKSSYDLCQCLQKFRLQFLRNPCSHHPSTYAQGSTNFALKFYKIPLHIILPVTPKSPLISPSNSVISLLKSSFHLLPSIHNFRLQILYYVFHKFLQSTTRSQNLCLQFCTIRVHIIVPSKLKSPNIFPSNSVQFLFTSSKHLCPNLHKFRLQIL